MSTKATFKVEVEVENEAFQPTPWPELARIFQGLVNDMHKEFVCVTLKDINGNTVGNTDFTQSKMEQRIVTQPKLDPILLEPIKFVKKPVAKKKGKR